MARAHRSYETRKACLAEADRIGNVRAACRVFNISPTTFYAWKRRADRYGLAGLRPRSRRRSTQPNQTPPWQTEIILAEAISRPTLGPARLLEHLEDRGVDLSASGVHKVLARHGLSRASERVGALAQITAAADGTATEEALEGEFGFCHFAAYPGDLAALDTFYVGKLKGVGKVWQFTAVDTATRWAVIWLHAGERTAQAAAAFLDVAIDRFAQAGIELSGVLTDRGHEFKGRTFQNHASDLGIEQTFTPPRSPNFNAVCERFQGTVLEEFYRPAFHRQFFTSAAALDAQLQPWLDRYNTRRRNHGDFMAGRRPIDLLQLRHHQFQQTP